MAKAGKGTKIKVGSDDMGGSSTWGFTPGTTSIDITAHQDGYEQILMLFKNGAGSITAFYDDTDAAQKAMIDAWDSIITVELNLYLDDVNYLSFNAYVMDMGFSTPVGGAVTVTFNFRASSTMLLCLEGLRMLQMVIVAKGGGDFTSIQAAIDSITDASESKPYIVLVGPGIYAEDIITKAYVYIHGVNKESCILQTSTESILLTASDNSGIENLTSIRTFDSSDATISIIGVSNFFVRNCNILTHASSYPISIGGPCSGIQIVDCNISGNSIYIISASGTTEVEFVRCHVQTFYYAMYIDYFISGSNILKIVDTEIETTYVGTPFAHGITLLSNASAEITLRNVKIICAEASANSIYADNARQIYGSNIDANREKHDNVTLIGDTFGIDVPKANTITVAKSGGMFTTIQAAIDSVNPIVHSGTAQAGAAATITLATTASAVDDYYNGMKVRLTGGTGSGQIRTIIDYVGSTKVATVDSNWTVQPIAGTTYAVKSVVTVSVYPGKYDEAIILKDCVDIVAHNPKGTKILQRVSENNVPCDCNTMITIDAQSTPYRGLEIRNANSHIYFKGEIFGGEELGGTTSAIYMTGGSLLVDGNIISRQGISIYMDLGTITVMNGYILNTNNDLNAHGILIEDISKVILKNVKIICTHADAKAIYAATAKNVKCMGVWANRDLHTNVTNLITGGFTYDTDVE